MVPLNLRKLRGGKGLSRLEMFQTMARRMTGNCPVRCRAGRKKETTSNSDLSLSSQSSFEYYRQDFKKMSPLRAIAETLWHHRNDSCHIEKVNARRAYELARCQSNVTVTDMPIYENACKRLGLPIGSTILDDNHGAIVGRSAGARKFYDRASAKDKNTLEEIIREAVFELQKRQLIKAEAIIGLDKDLMIKACMITTVDDASNVWNWLQNFATFEEYQEQYSQSRKLPIQDIIFVAYPQWKSPHPDYKDGLVVFDPYENVVYNLGMRYFGERKKGTLTLAWASGVRLGQVACHGGIKEIDFSACDEEKYKKLGKRSIAFFGLSGSGKSSHTNSHDNGKTLPKGFRRTILHDDAFQIDLEDRTCRVWEPTLFDKTDSRDMDHPDWKYCMSSQNNAIMVVDGKIRLLAQDVRNANGRCIFDRDLLGQGNYVNRCTFPLALCWLMKDETLPPVIKFSDPDLAIAMGATLMTKRTAAENVSADEMRKLVFEPFANPFRVYELYKDCEGFSRVIHAGSSCYCFNSGSFWASQNALNKIPLQNSLRINTAILCDELQWQAWNVLPGAMIPTPESIDAILPGYSTKFHADNVQDKAAYTSLLADRFRQRREYLQSSDLQQRGELLQRLIKVLQPITIL